MVMHLKFIEVIPVTSMATVMVASSTIGATAKPHPCHFRAAVAVRVVAFQAVAYIKNYTKFNFSQVIHMQKNRKKIKMTSSREKAL